MSQAGLAAWDNFLKPLLDPVGALGFGGGLGSRLHGFCLGSMRALRSRDRLCLGSTRGWSDWGGPIPLYYEFFIWLYIYIYIYEP